MVRIKAASEKQSMDQRTPKTQILRIVLAQFQLHRNLSHWKLLYSEQLLDSLSTIFFLGVKYTQT